MVFSDMTNLTVLPPSLSRDRKWPHVTQRMHSRVVGLRLEGNLVTTCLRGSGDSWCIIIIIIIIIITINEND